MNKSASTFLLASLPIVFVGVGCAGSSSSTSTSSSTPKTRPTIEQPAPTPPPALADLQEISKSLLDVTEEKYLEYDTKSFGQVMTQLLNVPRDSKDYKKAQELHTKLGNKRLAIDTDQAKAGPKPENRQWDGSVDAVREYLRASLNDYDSSEFVEWSPVVSTRVKKEPFWLLRLKLRAKNAFGAYVLRDTFYFMQNGRVVRSEGLQ